MQLLFSLSRGRRSIPAGRGTGRDVAFSKRGAQRLYSWLPIFVLLLSAAAAAQAPDPADAVCPRPAEGAVVAPPPELRSAGGVLELDLHLRNALDEQGLMRYCYVTGSGAEAPTLRVNPGDQLTIHFYNDLTADGTAALEGMAMDGMAAADSGDCQPGVMTATSSNLHFHGMSVAPVCHQDDVVNTPVEAGASFDYSLQIPANEPPGMYWYHPHPHGFSETQTQGGATGAIIVEGIQSTFPALASLPERTLILRDQPNASQVTGTNRPTWNISLNHVPILYPEYTPAVIDTPPAEQEFWRLANQAADTIFQVQIVAGGTPVALQVYAVDGVPVSGAPLSETSLVLPPGSRVEFVCQTPATGAQALMITTSWDTGAVGDSDPQRPIAQIVSSASAVAPARLPQARTAAASAPRRFAALAAAAPVVERQLTFSEVGIGDNGTSFFITFAGQTPAVFQMGQAPNAMVHAGTVEDWTVLNATQEDHVFHIHQLHFQALEINGTAVNDPAVRDTIDVPHWSGSGAFPSVKLRMDFRDNNIVGIFPFHCHILAHEDQGMMGLLQVLPAGIATTLALSTTQQSPGINAPVQITATVTPASGSTAPTGTLQFVEDGGAGLWQVPVVNGQAVLSTSFDSPGSHTFTGIYQGDANYVASQSAPLALTVAALNFTLAVASSIAIAAPGGAGTTTVSVMPQGGFTGAVQLSCSTPAAMTGASCSFSPSSVTGAGTATLTVSTAGAGSSASAPAGGRARWPLQLALLPCLTALLIGLPRRRSLLAVVAAMLLLFSVACGSGGSSPSQGSAGTPAGSYLVSVTGNSGIGATALSTTLNVGVTVQ